MCSVGCVHRRSLSEMDLEKQEMKEALEYFESRVHMSCSDCDRAYDDSCSGAMSIKCNAYRKAVYSIKKCMTDMFSEGIVYLDLSARAYNVLIHAGIFRISDILSMTEDELSKISYLSNSRIAKEIIEKRDLYVKQHS